jgi:CheY-like chemotaxis protein
MAILAAFSHLAGKFQQPKRFAVQSKRAAGGTTDHDSWFGPALFVDIESAIVKMVQTISNRLVYSVTACISSSKTLETFRQSPAHFDPVITDVNMPHMTRLSLAVALRETLPAVPVNNRKEAAKGPSLPMIFVID